MRKLLRLTIAAISISTLFVSSVFGHSPPPTAHGAADEVGYTYTPEFQTLETYDSVISPWDNFPSAGMPSEPLMVQNKINAWTVPYSDKEVVIDAIGNGYDIIYNSTTGIKQLSYDGTSLIENTVAVVPVVSNTIDAQVYKGAYDHIGFKYDGVPSPTTNKRVVYNAFNGTGLDEIPGLSATLTSAEIGIAFVEDVFQYGAITRSKFKLGSTDGTTLTFAEAALGNPKLTLLDMATDNASSIIVVGEDADGKLHQSFFSYTGANLELIPSMSGQLATSRDDIGQVGLVGVETLVVKNGVAAPSVIKVSPNGAGGFTETTVLNCNAYADVTKISAMTVDPVSSNIVIAAPTGAPNTYKFKTFGFDGTEYVNIPELDYVANDVATGLKLAAGAVGVLETNIKPAGKINSIAVRFYPYMNGPVTPTLHVYMKTDSISTRPSTLQKLYDYTPTSATAGTLRKFKQVDAGGGIFSDIVDKTTVITDTETEIAPLYLAGKRTMRIKFPPVENIDKSVKLVYMVTGTEGQLGSCGFSLDTYVGLFMNDAPELEGGVDPGIDPIKYHDIFGVDPAAGWVYTTQPEVYWLDKETGLPPVDQTGFTLRLYKIPIGGGAETVCYTTTQVAATNKFRIPPDIIWDADTYQFRADVDVSFLLGATDVSIPFSVMAVDSIQIFNPLNPLDIGAGIGELQIGATALTLPEVLAGSQGHPVFNIVGPYLVANPLNKMFPSIGVAPLDLDLAEETVDAVNGQAQVRQKVIVPIDTAQDAVVSGRAVFAGGLGSNGVYVDCPGWAEGFFRVKGTSAKEWLLSINPLVEAGP